MNLLAKCGQADKEQSSLVPCPLYRLHAEGIAQIKVVSACFKFWIKFMLFSSSKISGLKVYLSTSKIRLEVDLSF